MVDELDEEIERTRASRAAQAAVEDWTRRWGFSCKYFSPSERQLMRQPVPEDLQGLLVRLVQAPVIRWEEGWLIPEPWPGRRPGLLNAMPSEDPLVLVDHLNVPWGRRPTERRWFGLEPKIQRQWRAAGAKPVQCLTFSHVYKDDDRYNLTVLRDLSRLAGYVHDRTAFTRAVAALLA